MTQQSRPKFVAHSPLAPVTAYPIRMSALGPRLCENSDVELARRKFVSITLNNKRTALAVTVERRKERKQFCAFSARARFHTAWAISRHEQQFANLNRADVFSDQSRDGRKNQAQFPQSVFRAHHRSPAVACYVAFHCFRIVTISNGAAHL